MPLFDEALVERASLRNVCRKLIAGLYATWLSSSHHTSCRGEFHRPDGMKDQVSTRVSARPREERLACSHGPGTGTRSSMTTSCGRRGRVGRGGDAGHRRRVRRGVLVDGRRPDLHRGRRLQRLLSSSGRRSGGNGRSKIGKAKGRVAAENNDDMRASNQDREDTVAILCDAYAVGRLDLAGIRDRAGAGYCARTWGDLRRLTADLLPSQGVPAIWPVSIEGRSGTELRHRRARPAIFLLLAILGWLAMASAAFMAMAAAMFAAE